MPVPVVAVARKTIPITRDYVGATEAIRTVTLQAKVSGYLADRGAPDGADVGAGDLLYRIDQRDFQAVLDQVKAQAQRDAAALDYARANQQRNATFNPSESELAEIAADRARGPVVAELLLEGQDQPQFRGTLTFLDNTVDRATGTIVARATIANPDRRLLPGQYVRVRLRLGEQ